MKRLSKVACGALVTLAVLEGIAALVGTRLTTPTSWYTPSLEERHNFLQSAAYEDLNPSLVVVGSSMVGRAIDEKELSARAGVPSVNMGVPGATVTVINRWLFDFVLEETDPTHVVIGINSFEFHATNERNVIDRWDEQLATADDLTSPLERWAFRRLSMYRYRSTLTEPWVTLTAARAGPEASLTDVALFDIVRPDPPYDFDFHEEGMRKRLTGFEIASSTLSEYSEMLRKLRERDIKVTVVYMPVTAGYRRAHPNGDADVTRTRDVVAELTAQQDATFVDASSWMSQDYFYDNVHLTVEGAKVFSARLADTLD